MGQRRQRASARGRKTRVFLSPILEGAQHRPQIAALFGENVLGARRVIFVKAPLDDAAVLQRL